ncbi:low molecular weight protein-tyrosine-phosphatase [Roseibium polysiphoniae]|uniref:protein-tyrosine-phosphatase n=1 Tax=Roseibium polysiphoniae TaxID=2571221 RepID=A0ABR9CBW2_9HYPH|nr:low molecular weight protein-tyrosine-phosphatase [Roseibium polysiphoniae]MBD8877379.1 low molecular weight phosphotyrosine protein phosphatase [Roseibium polysiphoniae]
MTSILFVCLGNICRSPLAEGIFRHTLKEAGRIEGIQIDSAGTGTWHEGNPPDPRSIEVATRYGIDISGQRARQVRQQDFSDFDLILAMDKSNLSKLRQIAPKDATAHLRLFLDAPEHEVPDPYYGGDKGFEAVFHMLRSASERLSQMLVDPQSS